MKILCIFPLSGDGKTIQDALIHSLDLTPVLVHSNQEAYTEIASGEYKCVITGHNLPSVDVFQLLDTLSSQDCNLPVILATKEAEPDFLTKAIHAGLVAWYPVSKQTRFNEKAFSSYIETLARDFSAQQSAEFYKDLVDKAGDLIQSIGKDSHFIFVNQKWKDLLGYSDDEIHDMTLFDIMSDPNCESCHQQFQAICSGENVGLLSLEFVAKDGRKILVEGYATAKIKDGQFSHTRCVFRDVSERRQIESEKEKNRTKYQELYRLLRQMCDNIPDLI